jgi:hypothetical protein
MQVSCVKNSKAPKNSPSPALLGKYFAAKLDKYGTILNPTVKPLKIFDSL